MSDLTPPSVDTMLKVKHNSYLTNCNVNTRPCRDFAHLIVPDAVAEAEIPGDWDAGRLLVGAEQPLLRDGRPVGKVAGRWG